MLGGSPQLMDHICIYIYTHTYTYIYIYMCGSSFRWCRRAAPAEKRTEMIGKLAELSKVVKFRLYAGDINIMEATNSLRGAVGIAQIY